MRIISGRARGLKLTGPPGKSLFIRPTSDRSREAVFSILGERVRDARVLDLFAGTGALGLEALSRGGTSALFIDNDPTALAIIHKNIAAFLKCIQTHEPIPEIAAVRCDVRRGFSNFINTSAPSGTHFDIIFLDPPYDKGLALQTLAYLDCNNHLAGDGLIVVEEKATSTLPETYHTFVLVDKRKYGESGFWIYKKIAHPWTDTN